MVRMHAGAKASIVVLLEVRSRTARIEGSFIGLTDVINYWTRMTMNTRIRATAV